MKYRTTQKAVKANYKNVISVGYCDLQRLLACTSPVAYTARREGWGADIYDFEDTAIVTGHAPFGNIRPSYDLCKRYEREAEKLRHVFSYEEKKTALERLIAEFVREVIK